MMVRIHKYTILLALCCAAVNTRAQTIGSFENPYILNPSPTTVAWGYYWSEVKPCLKIHSGDFVKLHTLLTSNPERLEAAGLPPEKVEKELRDVQVVTLLLGWFGQKQLLCFRINIKPGWDCD